MTYVQMDGFSRFVNAIEKLADAAKVAADAYAKSVKEQGTPEYVVTVNVNGDQSANDVVTRVQRALNAQRVQDR